MSAVTASAIARRVSSGVAAVCSQPWSRRSCCDSWASPPRRMWSAWRSSGSTCRRLTVSRAAGMVSASARAAISAAIPPALTEGACCGSPSTHS